MPGSVKHSMLWCACGLLALGATGCATVSVGQGDGRSASESAQSRPTSLAQAPRPHLAVLSTTPAPRVTLVADAESASALSATEGEFFDPFAEPGEEMGEDQEEYDPWEPYNAVVFRFNYNLDDYVVQPVAEGYNSLTPDLVQRTISNVFQNVRFVPRFFNNVFQGKVKGAGIEISRFLINTTFGMGGLFDPATDLGLETPEEDFGQTLGFYGVGPGPYLLLPFWPSPLTVRDGFGYVVDLALDPFNYLVLPFTQVEDWPQAVTNKDTALILNWGLRIGEILNERSRNLETFQGVEEATVDLYSAVRNAYLQKRAKAIRE